jgi:hypothetical protein
MKTKTEMKPTELLRHHLTGSIQGGNAVAIRERLPLREIKNGQTVILFSRSGEKICGPFIAKILEVFNGTFYTRHLQMPDRSALPIYSDSAESFETV